MISTLTFDRVVEVFAEYLASHGREEDAHGLLLEHLGWQSADEGEFGSNVRIVLASADFSKELTTAVLWLNEQGLDVRCVRLTSYWLNEALLVDVQQVVPLPEASEYTVQVRAKRQETRQRQEQERDFTKYSLTLGKVAHEPLNKRRSILEVVRYLVKQSVSPEAILEALPENSRNRRFVRLSGTLDAPAISAACAELQKQDKRVDYHRYFHDPDELLYHDGETWLLTKMWGINTQSCLEALRSAFPQHHIEFSVAE